jgi:opacity protein-like surface antigen
VPFALASILALTSVNAFSDFKNTPFIGLGLSSGRDALYYKNMPTCEKPNANIYTEIGGKMEFESKFFFGGRVGFSTQQKMDELDFNRLKYGADIFAGATTGDRLSIYVFLGKDRVKTKKSEVFNEDFLIKGTNVGLGVEYLTTDKTAIVLEYAKSKTKGKDFGFGKNGERNPDNASFNSERLKVGFRYFI